MKKKCPKCKNIKSLEDFFKDKTNKDGHAHWCKNCGKEFQGKFARKYCEKKCSNDFFNKKAKAKKQIKEIGQYIGGTKQIGY